MNPFSPDDRVQCKASSRRNGTVLCIMCGMCEKCRTKPTNTNYFLCTADEKDKLKVQVSYPESIKRYKYHYTELEFEPPLTVKPPHKVYDLSAKDIRPLGDAMISVPLIVFDDEDEAEETSHDDELEEEIIEHANDLPNGITFDTFLSFQRMTRPI